MAYKNEKSKKSSDYVKEKRRIREDVCYTCGKKSEKRKCKDCSEKNRKYKKERYYHFKELGLCPECGGEVVGNSGRCEKHYLWDITRKALKTTKHYKELLKKFNEQNGLCYYTGIELFFGINASIDHKKSVSSGAPDVFTVENLVWCDLRINKMKNAMSSEEFYDICKMVYLNNKSPEVPMDSAVTNSVK